LAVDADRVRGEISIAVDTGRMTSGHATRASGTRGPCVYLHIGEPKTGTTFLQDALWANRARLAAAGLRLPGYSDRDHSRASRDLRETPRPASDPADPWVGEWDVLAGQALRARGPAVISNELLAAASPQQAERAVRSLLDGEVHVVATVRDFAAILPAEWQEAVKCRGTTGWDAWLDEVIAAGPTADRRRRSWCWRVHDTLAILDMWSRHIPPDQVHVVTVPRQDAAGVLWARFAAVLGFDPAGCDLTRARRNPSLGLAETEFLRRVNEALPAELPYWFYAREIKQILAHGVLSAGPHRSRPVLSPGQQAWAAEQADVAASSAAGPASQPAGPEPDVAAQAVAALAGRYFQARYPDRPAAPHRGARQRASDVKWAVLNGPRVRQVLRRASHHAAVQRLRVAIWCVLMRPGRHPR